MHIEYENEDYCRNVTPSDRLMCPLSLRIVAEDQPALSMDCQREECAWWHPKYGRCAVLSQAFKK